MSHSLPIIGASMPSSWLDTHLDWLLEHQRDLEISDFIYLDLLDNKNLAAHLREIKSKLEGYTGRMGIHGPFRNLPLAAYDPKIRAVVQERFKQGLDIAAEIGATHMVIHSPLEFLGAPSNLINPTIGDRDLFDVAHETLAPIVEQAEQVDCMLLIENTHDKYPRILTDLVRSFNSDRVRQSLDVGHAYIKYCEGAPPPDYYVRVAGDLLGHIHLQDTDGYSDRHWAIGEGKVDWEELFRAIAELESPPRLILELLRDFDTIPSAINYLTQKNLAI